MKPLSPEATYPNCWLGVVGIETVLPCQEVVVQQPPHMAFETPTRHSPAAVGEDLVKYEMDQKHELVAPEPVAPVAH